MNVDQLDQLIERLNDGDVAAAERAFLAYEPYLRMAVRRQLNGALRAKLDSMDIVQSVWADLLSGFREAGWRFNDRSHLRAFLDAGDPQPAHRSPPPASSGPRARTVAVGDRPARFAPFE